MRCADKSGCVISQHESDIVDADVFFNEGGGELTADQKRALAESIARDGERSINDAERIFDWILAAVCVLAIIVVVALLRAEHAHGDRPLRTINEVIHK